MSDFYESNHLLDLAIKILENSDNLICDNPCVTKECIYRTVINRCYYAAFLTAREKAKIVGYSEPEKHVHMELFKFLTKHQRKMRSRRDKGVFKTTRKSLGELNKLRKVADYEFMHPIDEYDAQLAISLSKKVINNFDTLSKFFKG